MKIRFGVCTTIDKIPTIIDAGYDYIELCFASVVTMSDEEFEKTKNTLEKYNIKAESYNGFFPGDMRLTGEGVDFEKITAYIEKGMERISKLGGKVTIIGSGRSRNIPDGFDFKEGYNQFAKVMGIAGDIAAKYGITVVVEPLCTEETNLINTVAQGIELAKKVSKPNVKSLADFYHVYKSGETLDAIRTGGKWLGHLHIARANPDRSMPYEEDIPTVEEWAAAVKTSGYEGRLSLEGGFRPEFTECMHRTRKIIDCFNK
ncbi:MAG: sugar phosphate isomerase/epimerase family protein [Acutalibacteraceae bacterium]|nr:sugar phosphate isomerase/epimerase family protein [Acutalibacteraceae bacterium]